MAKKSFISQDTVISALRALSSKSYKRTGRTALMGFLLVMAKQPSRGGEFAIASTGPESVEEELKKFFRVAPGTPFPDVNPFGQKEGRIEFLTPGYERRGTYTHLYPGRNLNPVLNVKQEDGRFLISVPPDAAQKIAGMLGDKVPLKACASFLLRNSAFPENASDNNVIKIFRDVFHLTDEDIDALFEDSPDFSINFSDEKFSNSIAALPSDLQPSTQNTSHASAARAGRELVTTAQKSDVELAISDVDRRRLQRAIARSKAVALVGAPGTGKSRLWEWALEEAVTQPQTYGLAKSPTYVCYTAEIDWTARTLIGGYYPQKDGQLEFKEGYLLQAIRNNQILWIDEMNRADLDRVLGPVLTFLAGQSVDLGPTHLGSSNDTDPAKSMVLMWAKGEKSGVEEDDQQRVYYVGSDWRLLGTYNNVDRGRVFPMGSALLRRWAVVPIAPIDSSTFADIISTMPNVQTQFVDVLKAAYDLHLEFLPIGPAPFFDMAKYVVGEKSHASGALLSGEERELLADAYVLYMGPQIARLDPEQRESFFDGLSGIFGADLANEAATF